MTIPENISSKQKPESSAELLREFLSDCQDRGLARSSTGTYKSHLRHFVDAFNGAVPTTWPPLELFLTKRIRKKDARPRVRKSLQSFYAFIERKYGDRSPIPRGQVGRPRKIGSNVGVEPNYQRFFGDKLVQGGGSEPIRIEFHIFIHGPGS